MIAISELNVENLRDLPQPIFPVALTFSDKGPPVVQVIATVIGDDDEPSAAFAAVIDLGFHPGGPMDARAQESTGWIPLDKLNEIDNDDERVYIEAAHLVYPELDVSVPEALNAAAHAAPTSTWTGAGVIVGIIDQGVDVTHASLRRADQSTRIISLWDQSINGVTARPSTHYYGNEWTDADINQHLYTGTPCPSTDDTGHGTAVAGIAAGNGFAAPAGKYVGVAPEAELVVVKLGTQQHSFAATNNVIDAIEYVCMIAAAQGRPAVVNLSQGSQIGSHDEYDQIERDLASRFGQDTTWVVVTSAGNSGAQSQHARAGVPHGGSVDFVVDVPKYGGPFVVADIWYDLSDQCDIEIVDPTHTSSGTIHGTSSARGLLGSQWIVAGAPNRAGTGASRIVVTLQTVSGTGDVVDGQWTLRVHGTHMVSGRPVDVWLERGWDQASFSTNIDATCTVTSPAACREMLAVTSYELTPTLGSFVQQSGRGPDRRGHAVTIIAAPGQPVTAPTIPSQNVALHHPVNGTSFAAAHVTGAIALMREAGPSLSRSDLLDCLTSTARPDADTAAGPAEGWGAGKLDITAALACAVTKQSNYDLGG